MSILFFWPGMLYNSKSVKRDDWLVYLCNGFITGAGAGGAVQMEYGNVPLAPLLWLDDIIRGAELIEQARRVNEKIYFWWNWYGIVPQPGQISVHNYGLKNQKKNATLELGKLEGTACYAGLLLAPAEAFFFAKKILFILFFFPF